MAAAPLVFIKKIMLKLKDSPEAAVRAAEPLLTAYKGAEIKFKENNKRLITNFTIGASPHKNDVSITFTSDTNNITNMILAVSTHTTARQEDSATIFKKFDILIEDILFHLMPGLNIEEKAKLLEKGKICPNCKTINDSDGKFCKECGLNFLDLSFPPAESTQKASIETERPTSPESKSLTVQDLSNKYPKQYECELCDMKCAYKDPFILILSDKKNLEEPFKRFDEFLRTKDLAVFSDYIYDYAYEQMKKYPKFSIRELNNIAFCIFSILSFHILEKAPKNIRLTFAKKMKERINARFNKEYPSISSVSLIDTKVKSPLPTIKTGTLRIEENRCPYCYKKFDDRILKLKLKGYMVECPNCGTIL